MNSCIQNLNLPNSSPLLFFSPPCENSQTRPSQLFQSQTQDVFSTFSKENDKFMRISIFTYCFFFHRQKRIESSIAGKIANQETGILSFFKRYCSQALKAYNCINKNKHTHGFSFLQRLVCLFLPLPSPSGCWGNTTAETLIL